MRVRSVRPAVHQLGIRIEPIEKHFVFRSQQLKEEAIQSLTRGEHLLAVHAAAGIERDTKADRYPLAVEVRDLLGLIVFEETEVLFPKPRDEPAAGVGHRRVDVDEFDTRPEAK